MKRAAILLGVLAAACGEPASGSSASDGDSESETGDVEVPPDPRALYCGDAADEVDARIDAWLAEMSVAQKVAMMHGAGLLVVDDVWLVEGDAARGIPGLHMLDGPRGLSRFSGQTGTAFPVGIMRGATWDPELERRVGAAMARELRSVGADTLLAPTMNVLRHPRWGRAQETYGEDVVHLGAMAVGFIEGVQSEHVIATAKHYAANSIEDTRFDVDVTLDERTLREIYLPHFRRAVTQAGVGAVMSAYNSVNGFHCDVNRHLLTEILVDEWQFQGFVMSDWIFGTHGDVEPVRAGLHVEMPAGTEFAMLAEKVDGGQLEIAAIDNAVRRVLRAQLCFELDVSPPVPDETQRNTLEHRVLAYEAASRGLVLLRNEGVLPLDRGALGSIAVVGPLADVDNLGDRGSSDVLVDDVVTVLEGLRDRAGAVEIVTTVDEAAAADVVVVVVGLTSEDEGEGLIAAGDRETLALPDAQVELLHAVAALGRPTIVVLEGGSAILVDEWLADADALLMAWYPGVEGGHAIADVLFGDVEPSGRLPISVPRAEADLPEFDNVSTHVTYGFLHGYRHLDANAIAPAFAFGHGLAYTTFDYADLVLDAAELGPDDTLRASVDVTNTGARVGRETVQLYVGMPDSAVERAPKDLRAFSQVWLEPGARATVTLEVPVRELAYWDIASASWTVEPGEIVVQVGGSSADAGLQTRATIGP